MVAVNRDHSNHDLRSFARQVIKGCEKSRLIKVEPLADEPELAHLLRWLQVGSYRTTADLYRELQLEISAVPGVGALGAFLYSSAGTISRHRSMHSATQCLAYFFMVGTTTISSQPL